MKLRSNLLWLWLAVLLGTGANLRADDALPKPSFVFLLVDDLRWDALGYAGNEIVQTPVIDRLAKSGVAFSNMFCTTSICATSRASILTGQYARRHTIHNFRAPLSPAAFAKTFPAILRASGYRTGFVGKWGLGGALPKDQYDVFTGFSGQGRYFQKGRKEHLTRIIESQAVSFLDRCNAAQPFCLQVSFKAVHCQDGDPWPFQPDRKYSKLYENRTIPKPPTATQEVFDELPSFIRESEARRRWQIRYKDDALFQKSMKDYYRLITGVDEAIGKMIEKLESKGLAKNTVIVFTSDNGFYLGDRGLAGKWFMHEESIRLPLFIHDPRAPESRRGRTVNEMALTIDVAPTLLDLAGIEPPRAMQGRSLRPFLDAKTPTPKWREDWFYEHLFQHRRIPRSEGVRTSKLKYVNFLDMAAPRGSDGNPLAESYEELYDLEKDPAERVNIAHDSARRADLVRMRARWKSLRESTR